MTGITNSLYLIPLILACKIVFFPWLDPGRVQGMIQHNDLLLCLQMFFAVIRHLCLLIWLLPRHTQSLGDRGTIFLNDDILKGWLPGP